MVESAHHRIEEAIDETIRSATDEELAEPDVEIIRSRVRERINAYFDKPLFAENFSASLALDRETQTTVKDWNTFYEGAQRLAQYLRYTGRNGAIISVACEGSTLYPSRVFSSTPKYDNGVFFSNGQDPVQKDVLELLLRVFHREGLKLIPAIHFSSPLTGLDLQLRQAPEKAQGILLENHLGRTWSDPERIRKGLGPHYNPLDERVQGEMRRAIKELAARYGNRA